MRAFFWGKTVISVAVWAFLCWLRWGALWGWMTGPLGLVVIVGYAILTTIGFLVGYRLTKN